MDFSRVLLVPPTYRRVLVKYTLLIMYVALITLEEVYALV